MRWKAGVAFFLTAVLLCACKGAGAEETVSMYDLRVAMEAAGGDSLPEMMSASSVDGSAEEIFKNISDEMDYGKVDSFFVSYASEGGKADEIVVIAVKDIADIGEAESYLKEHRQSRYKLLEQYEPEESKRVEDGLVFTDGRYAVLIICNERGAVKDAFLQAVR